MDFSGWREGNACIAFSTWLETLVSSTSLIIPQWIVSHFSFFPSLYLSIRSCSC